MNVPKPTSAESFDPYHKWLGIPPKDQPPTHYRLLGIDLLESDPDVIVSATDQRMAHVRSFQTGKNSALSQKILNELAAAKVCLLNARKKAEYDAKIPQLQRAPIMPPTPCGTSTVPPSVERVMETPSFADEIFDLGLPAVKISRKKKKPQRQSSVVWVVGLVAGSVAAAILTRMLVLNPTEEGRKVAETERTLKTEKEIEPKIVPKREPRVAPKPAPENEPNVTSKVKSEPVPEPALVAEAKSEPLPAPDARPKPSIQTKPQPVPLPKPESNVEPERDARGDPPSERAQKAALAIIRNVYKQDYKTADNASLAKKLLRKGKETRNDPVARFVLFREARDLAMAVGDGPVVFQAIDAMAAEYKISAPEMKEAMLETASKVARLPPQHGAIAEAALGVINAAIADEDFQVVKRLGRLALAHARQARDASLVQQVVAKNKESDDDAKLFLDAKNALAALEKTPDDPAANAIAGKYLCFQKGNWKRGLPMLAKDIDAVYKALAEKDWKGPESADDQVKLGDEWWQRAEKAKGIAKSQLQKRAAYWYDREASGATGLVKDKVESRIKEALTVVTPYGVIQPGNLALASNGTTVSGVTEGAAYLLDGNVTNYSDGIHGLASGLCPCEWTIHFRETYQLRQIRFLLFDLDPPRFYRYKVEVSDDGQEFAPLIDRSQGEWRGWQEIAVPGESVKAIKLIGLYCSGKDARKGFQVVEVEAYSIIPRASQGR